MPGGKASGETSGALIATPFDGADGADSGGTARAGTEPVGSPEFGNVDCDGNRDAGGAGAGAAGAVLAARLGAALGWALGTAKVCGAGRACGVDSAGEFCPGFPPVLPAAAPSGGGTLWTGGSSATGADAAGGCSDPLCGPGRGFLPG